ncbi:secreted RxLR effector protein 161-like [Magnolia sinica]|uniref:secreted RxLR effector protein 161-like n=1 Tax=Magnolia sinica TaxID=86752 RepID=UPI0026585425|nr:secreted RxLR effector protein 161-like [Magnolia sinica]
MEESHHPRHDGDHVEGERPTEEFLGRGNSKAMFVEFKQDMFNEFEMIDGRLMSFFLGIKVKQQVSNIYISQKKYVKELLEKFKMTDCNTVNIPVATGLKLTKEGELRSVDLTIFKSLIGSLIYFTFTRSDIVYSVRLLSRYTEVPKESHWLVAKRILRYVKGTVKFGLFYPYNDEVILYGYSDNDSGGYQDERKNTKEYVFYLGSTTFTWNSKKQSVVTLFICEVEFVAVSSIVCEAI